MSWIFSRINIILLVCVTFALVFGVICLDKHQKNMSSHTESVLTGCANDSDSYVCTTSHEFLGNLAVVSTLFLLILLVVLGSKYIFTVASKLFKERNVHVFYSSVSQSQTVFAQHNYLVQAFSSGILNSRLYN
jgi:hypothetical protein